MRIGLRIEQFFLRPRGRKVRHWAGRKPSLAGQAQQLAAKIALVGITFRLSPGEMRPVVADIEPAVITHGAGRIKGFVHAVASAIDELSWRPGSYSQDCRSLHMRRRSYSCQA